MHPIYLRIDILTVPRLLNMPMHATTIQPRPVEAHGCEQLITFYVSRRRRKMYCGHARLCVRGRTLTLLHGPGCNLGAW